jgi:hypothetical protein
MIAVSVGQQDMRHALDRCGLVGNESGIAGENGSIRTAWPAKSNRNAE